MGVETHRCARGAGRGRRSNRGKSKKNVKRRDRKGYGNVDFPL